MPLPWLQDQSKRCTARSKRSGERCKNPAVKDQGMGVCRFHGYRSRSTVRSETNHPNFKHGERTKQSIEVQRAESAELKRLEAQLKKMGVIK